VVAFARSVALHPETWLDFPLPDDADSDGISIFSLLVMQILFTVPIEI